MTRIQTNFKTLIFWPLVAISLLLAACAPTAQQSPQRSAHEANKALYEANRTLYNVKALSRNLSRF